MPDFVSGIFIFWKLSATVVTGTLVFSAIRTADIAHTTIANHQGWQQEQQQQDECRKKQVILENDLKHR